MAQPCKVFSYTNVGTEKGVLANIASAAQAGGWTVDKNAVDADGELYLHSAGGGNRRLFFSLRLLQAHDNAERFLLAVHGNTGFDASAASTPYQASIAIAMTLFFSFSLRNTPVEHTSSIKSNAESREPK